MVLLFVGIQQLGQAKVGDLDMLGGLHQDVPGRQVAVDQMALLEVVHPLESVGCQKWPVTTQQVNLSIFLVGQTLVHIFGCLEGIQ